MDLTKYRLPPPEKRGYSLAQLADWRLVINGGSQYVMRVDENDKPLRIPAGYPGAGQPAEHGYLTPAEAEHAAANRRKQTVARRPYADAAE